MPIGGVGMCLTVWGDCLFWGSRWVESVVGSGCFERVARKVGVEGSEAGLVAERVSVGWSVRGMEGQRGEAARDWSGAGTGGLGCAWGGVALGVAVSVGWRWELRALVTCGSP